MTAEQIRDEIERCETDAWNLEISAEVAEMDGRIDKALELRAEVKRCAVKRGEFKEELRLLEEQG